MAPRQTSLSAVSDRDLLLSSRPAHSSYPVGAASDDDEDTSILSHSAAQRSRLLQSTQTLSSSSNRLDNAHRLAAENEEIGQGVLNSLVGQRMQLTNANEHLEEADLSIDRARGTIGRMIRLCVPTTDWPFSALHSSLHAADSCAVSSAPQRIPATDRHRPLHRRPRRAHVRSASVSGRPRS